MMMNCERSDYFDRTVTFVNESMTAFWNRLGKHYRAKLRADMESAQNAMIGAGRLLADDWGTYKAIASSLENCIDELKAGLAKMQSPGIDRSRAKLMLQEACGLYVDLACHAPEHFERAEVCYDEETGEVFHAAMA